MHPARGLFEGKLIPIRYACVQVEQLLKSSYEDNEIDFSTADGKSCLGECVGTTILWHKRDILLVNQVPLAALGAYQRHLAMTPTDANLVWQYFMNHE